MNDEMIKYNKSLKNKRARHKVNTLSVNRRIVRAADAVCDRGEGKGGLGGLSPQALKLFPKIRPTQPRHTLAYHRKCLPVVVSVTRVPVLPS